MDNGCSDAATHEIHSAEWYFAIVRSSEFVRLKG